MSTHATPESENPAVETVNASSSVLGTLGAGLKRSASCVADDEPTPKTRKIKLEHAPKVEVEADAEDDEDDESEDSGDESDDSIVVGSDHIEVEDEAPLPREDDEEGAKAMAEVLRKEAARFVGDLEVRVKGGRTLRAKPQQRAFPERALIKEAFEEDEKRELINEIKMWRKTLSAEATTRGIVFPDLKLTMTLEEVRAKHEETRVALGLEDDDEESESDEAEDEAEDEDEDDEDEGAEEEEEEREEEESV